MKFLCKAINALDVVFHCFLSALNCTVIHCSSQVLLRGSRQSFSIIPQLRTREEVRALTQSAPTMNHRLVLLCLAMLILKKVRGKKLRETYVQMCDRNATPPLLHRKAVIESTAQSNSQVRQNVK